MAKRDPVRGHKMKQAVGANTPDQAPQDAVSLLLQSIVLEEMSLAALLYAEAEKLQEAPRGCVLETNDAVSRMLRESTRIQLLLILEEALGYTVEDGYRPCCDCDKE